MGCREGSGACLGAVYVVIVDQVHGALGSRAKYRRDNGMNDEDEVEMFQDLRSMGTAVDGLMVNTENVATRSFLHSTSRMVMPDHGLRAFLSCC